MEKTRTIRDLNVEMGGLRILKKIDERRNIDRRTGKFNLPCLGHLASPRMGEVGALAIGRDPGSSNPREVRNKVIDNCIVV